MDSREIYQGKIFSLVQQQMEIKGKLVWRDVIKHPGGAAISAVRDGKILLVSQPRPGAGGRKLLEIPAGMIDPGEKPETAAMRELNEETGWQAGSLSLITAFWPTPGYDSEVIYVFKAHDLAKAAIRRPMDADEQISLEWMDLDEAFEKIQNGTIRDGKTIIAIYHEKLLQLASLCDQAQMD